MLTMPLEVRAKSQCNLTKVVDQGEFKVLVIQKCHILLNSKNELISIYIFTFLFNPSLKIRL